MSQEGLDFGRDHRVSEAHRTVLRVLNDVVDAVGLLVSAGACGCRTQELSDALGGRTTRYVRIEWVLALLDIAPLDYRLKLASALLNWIGLAPKPLKPMTAQERLEMHRQETLRRFGPAGAAMLDDLDAGGRS